MLLLEHIKEDWLYRLPYRLDHMRYKGLNRPAYTLICLVYYAVKSIIVLCLVGIFYLCKLLFWDIWVWLFRRDRYVETYEEEENYEEEKDCIEEAPDPDDIDFCQLFAVGDNMCLLIDHVEMSPDEVALIRVADNEGYTPLYKRKVRRDKAGNRYLVFNGTNYYLDDDKTQPVLRK